MYMCNTCAMCIAMWGAYFPTFLLSLLWVPFCSAKHFHQSVSCYLSLWGIIFFIVIVLVLLLWRATSLKRNRMILAWVTVPVGWRDGAALLLHLGAECHSSWLMSCKKYVYTRSDPKAEGLKWEPPVPTPLLWTEWLPLSPTCVDTVAGAGMGSPYALAGKQLTCHLHTQLCLWPTSANQAT